MNSNIHIQTQIENALRSFACAFLETPFLHRTEHSIHMQIANYLSQCPELETWPSVNILARDLKSKNKIWTISRIQKEWPTGSDITEDDQFYTEPLPDTPNIEEFTISKTIRRGSFDLAILPRNEDHSPISIDSWKHYYDGFTPKPLAIIEVGLDYKASDHLAKDIRKVKRYTTRCDSYFVHLYRHESKLLNVELEAINLITSNNHAIRTILSETTTNETSQSQALAFIAHLPPCATPV